MATKYHGIPREEIQWFPKIDRMKCTKCGVCVNFCHQGVYKMTDEGAVVEDPYSCVVACTGCKGKCESEAISFPTMRELAKELHALKKKHSKS